METVQIAMVAPAPPYYPALFAHERGFFAKRGIDSRLLITGTTDRVTTELVNGDSQIAMATTEGIVAAACAGKPVRIVAGNCNTAPLSLITVPGITRIEDLRGKKIGTSSLTEGTAILAQKILAANGLTYPGDYEFAIVGAHPQRWDLLQSGGIDGALQPIPYNYIAEEAGFNNLGEAGDYVPAYAFSCIAVNTDWAANNPHLAEQALAALHDAVQWAVAEPEEAAVTLAALTKTSLEHSRRALSELVGSVTPTDLRIDQTALKAVLAVMTEENLVPQGTKLDYESCVDESLLTAAVPS